MLGRYVIEHEVGSGATGTIYRARTADGQTTVAIKVLAPEMARQPDVVAMFEEEAKVGLQLSHPNIVRTVEVGGVEGVPYLVFEFVEGVPLAQPPATTPSTGTDQPDGSIVPPSCRRRVAVVAQTIRLHV